MLLLLFFLPVIIDRPFVVCLWLFVLFGYDSFVVICWERAVLVAFHLHCFTWTASSEFGTYRLCEQRRFRRACASAQSRQNLRCSLIQAVSQEEPSDRKPDPWPLWMAGHAQLKFVMTECSKTQIRLTGLSCVSFTFWCLRKDVEFDFIGAWSLPFHFFYMQ